MSTDLAVYEKIERRIQKGDVDALLARWEFGRRLLKERGAASRLPNGRLEQLCNALQSSARELGYRMQFAEQYRTEGEARSAFKDHGSWYAICQWGLGRRRKETDDWTDGLESKMVNAAWGRLAKEVGEFLEEGRRLEFDMELVVNDRSVLHELDIDKLLSHYLVLNYRVQYCIEALRRKLDHADVRWCPPSRSPKLTDYLEEQEITTKS